MSPRRAPSRPAIHRLVASVTVVAAVLAITACGDDGGTDRGAVDDPAAVAAAALERAATGGTAPAGGVPGTEDDDEPVQLDPTTIRGQIIDQYSLELEDCFDRLEDLRAGRPVVITTRLSCDEPHHFQVFARLTYPAEHPSTYPGDEVMVDFAVRSCYQRFEEWVGVAYEVSELEIGVLTPTRENFEDSRARYRGIHCWVEHVDGTELVGSMRGSGR